MERQASIQGKGNSLINIADVYPEESLWSTTSHVLILNMKVWIGKVTDGH